MFLPTIDEVLEGLHRTMERAVIPAIEDPYARAQAMSVSLRLLGLVERWAAIEEWAAIENDEMRAALARCAEELGGSQPGPDAGSITAISGDIRVQLAREYPLEPARRSLSSLAEEGQHLGLLMEEVILRLEELQREQPGDDSLAAARAAIRDVIRVQAERRDPKLDSSEIQHPN